MKRFLKKRNEITKSSSYRNAYHFKGHTIFTYATILTFIRFLSAVSRTILHYFDIMNFSNSPKHFRFGRPSRAPDSVIQRDATKLPNLPH